MPLVGQFLQTTKLDWEYLLQAHLEFLNVGCESSFGVHIQWRSYLNILYLHEFVGKVVVPVELKVTNYENRDEMLYSQAPCTNFQKYIRLKRPDMFQSIVVAKNASGKKMLYDHIPLQRMMMITKEFVLFQKRREQTLGICLVFWLAQITRQNGTHQQKG